MIKNRHSSQDQTFFRQIWAERLHVCEECGIQLLFYSASNMSHHLSKSAFPALRYEEKNMDLLCYPCHKKWESSDKKKMKIYSEDRREELIRLSYGVKEEVV